METAMGNRRQGLCAGLALAAALLGGCDQGSHPASAMQVTARHQLVGGPRALGDLGDFVLSNGRVRAVVQGNSASRGFGVFGGSLIDLDLEHPRSTDEGRPVGGDGLAEIFPAFFLQGLEPSEVFVKADGSDGGPAIVTARGKGGEFITMVKPINELLLGVGFEFEIDYILEPVGADAPPEEGRSLLIRATARNASQSVIPLAIDDFPLGFGLIVLMGSGQPLFLPGEAGFDLRFTLEKAYANPPRLPGIAGVVSRAMVASGEEVSYAITPEASRNNFVWRNRDLYPDVTRDSLVIPFVSSSFTGAFFHAPPAELAPGQSTSFSSRIFVGSGGVSTALDLALQAKGEPLGTFSAIVREEGSGVPVAGATVSLHERGSDSVLNACRTLEDGRCHARLPPGRFRARVIAKDRPSFEGEPFELTKNQTFHQELSVGASARLTATVVDASGRPLPAKISVVGRYGPEHAGKRSEEFLSDLKSGEPFLYTDMVEDDAARPETLEYLERTFFSGAAGQAESALRPGSYRVVASRGIAYTTAEQLIELAPGQSKALSFRLDRVADAPGYVHGDFHTHTRNSIDSAIGFETRAITFAAEGIEQVTIADHNFVSDLASSFEAVGLADWVKPMVGVEMTTLELGHFNGYPLRFDPGPVTHGSFDWFRHPAQQVFDGLRERGALEDETPIVQVNHPRDTIMGYFNTFYLDEAGRPSETSSFVKPHGPEFVLDSWSEEFDAIEILNGKHNEFIHSFRVPEVLPPPPLPAEIPPAGSLVRTKEGKVAFPGGFEDWFAMMKRGRVYTGMANSDSHETLENEAGYARSLVRLGKSVSTARAIEPRDVVRAIKAQAVLMTNGPIVEIWANGAPMGELVRSGPDGAVTLEIKVSAAPWIDVTRVRLIGSDDSVEEIPLAPAADGVLRAEVKLEKRLARDTFFVVEAEGERGMWPVVPGIENGPLMISDAVASIGGSFGFGDDGFGNLRPALTHPVTPFALTNPVWIDVDGDGACFGKGKLQQGLKSASRPPAPSKEPRQVNLVKLLQALSR